LGYIALALSGEAPQTAFPGIARAEKSPSSETVHRLEYELLRPLCQQCRILGTKQMRFNCP
jgi:hypothetical protein